MPVGGYSLAESPNKGASWPRECLHVHVTVETGIIASEAVTGGGNTMFPSRGLANAGMQQMSPRFPAKTGGPSPSINTHGHFDELEAKFKFWVNGSEAGKSALWKAWDAIDYNGNNVVSLAEIDRWVVDTYPQLNNKPVTCLHLLDEPSRR